LAPSFIKLAERHPGTPSWKAEEIVVLLGRYGRRVGRNASVDTRQLDSVRLRSNRNHGQRTQTQGQRRKKKKRSASKHEPCKLVLGDKKSAWSTKRDDQNVFLICFQKLRTAWMVSAPFEPTDNHVSENKSDDCRS
jgi:hypothetical protein